MSLQINGRGHVSQEISIPPKRPAREASARDPSRSRCPPARHRHRRHEPAAAAHQHATGTAGTSRSRPPSPHRAAAAAHQHATGTAGTSPQPLPTSTPPAPKHRRHEPQSPPVSTPKVKKTFTTRMCERSFSMTPRGRCPSFGNFVVDMQRYLGLSHATVSILHSVSEMRRNNKVGGLRTSVRVPSGSPAAHVAKAVGDSPIHKPPATTFAWFHSGNQSQFLNGRLV
jgi:hypothetical protein